MKHLKDLPAPVKFKKQPRRSSIRAFPKEHFHKFRCGTYLVSQEDAQDSDKADQDASEVESKEVGQYG